MQNPLPLKIRIAGLIALGFGALTIFSGGSILFADGTARQAAGNYVPFVLWFNFAAGFAYIVAGVGLIFWKRWAISLSMFIAIASLVVFAALGVVIFMGTPFEPRTLAAMTLRTVLWFTIAFMAISVSKTRPAQ